MKKGTTAADGEGHSEFWEGNPELLCEGWDLVCRFIPYRTLRKREGRDHCQGTEKLRLKGLEENTSRSRGASRVRFWRLWKNRSAQEIGLGGGEVKRLRGKGKGD